MAAPDTSIASFVPSAWDEGGEDYRYLAPEVQWPEDYGMDKVLITKESDVYGMAMVIYEARYHRPISFCPRSESHVYITGFDGEKAVLQL